MSNTDPPKKPLVKPDACKCELHVVPVSYNTPDVLLIGQYKKTIYKEKDPIPFEKWIFCNSQPFHDDDHIVFVAMISTYMWDIYIWYDN
jgi:hypothetical protein